MNCTKWGALGGMLLRWAAVAAGIALAAGVLRYLNIDVERGERMGPGYGCGVPTDADIPENTPAVDGAEPRLLRNAGVRE